MAITQKSDGALSGVLREPGDERATVLERILKNPRIPSPPTLALQVFQKSGQEDCNVKEISDLLSHDPGMCAKILKTLNSVSYSRSLPVTSVRQAVATLGTRPLRSLVLGLALPAMQTGVKMDTGLRRFWQRSVAGAVMARELAMRCGLPGPDDEMAASLLRDLGMILLNQVFTDQYRPLWTGEVEYLDEQRCAWEERQFGVHHAEVSAALLDRWQLPMEIVEPIRFHHHPHLMPDLVKRMVDRTHLLDFVGRLAELDGRSKHGVEMERLLQTARTHYSMERADLEQFLGMVRPKIDEFSKILGVDIGACPDFDELLASGCEELVRASLEQPDSCVNQGSATPFMTLDHSIGVGRRSETFLDSECLVPGSRILQYEVIEVIGRGAMGIVLKAKDPGLARHVAIKLLAPEMAGSDKARKRFALEARFAAALRHEHVVAVYAVNEFDGMPFLVMEYVKGASLGDRLDTGEKFSVAEIARIGRQIALGLAAAHDARLIHRDIKPANILLEEGTLHVRVADFGLARALDEDFQLSQPGLLLGTPYYMAPEQVDGLTLTSAADLFALGSVLYTMCTGQPPFQADTLSALLHAVAEKQPTPIDTLNPDVPIDIIRVIEKLHAKNPDDRPSSAAAVAEALLPWTVARQAKL